MTIEFMGLFLMLTTLFVFGAIIGSFLNVVILRHNTGKSLAGRSGCMVCSAQLSGTELVPIISYVCQMGKCTTCKSAISKQYILVELATATLFALTGWFAFVAHDLSYFVTGLLLIAMAIIVILTTYDFKHTILPDKYTYSFAIIAALAVFIMQPDIYQFGWQLVGGLTTALPIFALWFFSRGRAMGFGDVKLSVGIGIFLGVYLGISAVWYAFIIGALYGVTLMALRKAGAKSEVAFGPFLILGFLIVFFTQVGFMEVVNSIMFI